MRGIVLNLMLAALLPAILAAPHLGVLGYYWISYMAPQHLTWGAVDLPWAKIVALVTVVAWLFSREPKRIPLGAVSLLLLLLALWTAFTLPFALFPDAALAKGVEFFKVVVVTFLATALISSRERLQAMIWVICLSLGYYAVKGGIFVAITAGGHDVLGPLNSPFSQTNGMARAVIMTLPLLYFLYLHSAQRLSRAGLMFAIVLSVLALIGTGSRGGFVAFVAMLGFAWLHSRRKAKLLGIAVALTLAGAAILPQDRLDGWTGRIGTIESYEEDASMQGRFGAWRYALDLAAERPLTGGGFGAFLGNVTADPVRPGSGGAGYTESHSNYFEMLGEHGYIGLALYLVLAFAAYRSNSRCIREARGRPELYWARDLALMLQASMVGYLVGGLTINDAFLELYYSLIGMSVVLRRLVRAAVGEETAVAGVRRRRDGMRVRPVRSAPLSAAGVRSRG